MTVKNPLAILALRVGSIMPAPDIESVLSSRPRGSCTGMARAFEAVAVALPAQGAPGFFADEKDATSAARLGGTPPMAASGGSAPELIVHDLHHHVQSSGFGRAPEPEPITENAYSPLTPGLRQAQPPRISAIQ